MAARRRQPFVHGTPLPTHAVTARLMDGCRETGEGGGWDHTRHGAAMTNVRLEAGHDVVVVVDDCDRYYTLAN